MRKIRIALALVLATVAPAAVADWPPEPMIEMRVPVAPTAFPSAGRTYLVYEIHLTNESKAPLAVRRLELRDADKLTAESIAVFEAESLDKILQHFGNPRQARGADPVGAILVLLHLLEREPEPIG